MSLNKSWDVKAASLHFSGDRNKTAWVPRKTSTKIEDVYPVLCIHCCLWEYENQSGCTVTFAKRTDCWSTNCDQGFWDIVFQGQPTKASGMGFGHFPQNNRSTAVNSNLYGSLLLLCFFENINNDNPFIELLAMCQVHSEHFVWITLFNPHNGLHGWLRW